jgi:hypothetical protein
MAGGVIRITPSPGSYLIQESHQTVETDQVSTASVPQRTSDLAIRAGVTVLICSVVAVLAAHSAFARELLTIWPFPIANRDLKAACATYKSAKYEHNRRNPLVKAGIQPLDANAYRSWTLEGDRINQRLVEVFGVGLSALTESASGRPVSAQALVNASAQCYAAGVNFGDLDVHRQFPQIANASKQ